MTPAPEYHPVARGAQDDAAGSVGPLLSTWRDHLGPGARPRRLTLGLPVPSSGERDVWAQADLPTLTALAARAEADRTQPWPVPLASDYARFFRDGDRTAYEDRVRERQHRLSRAAVMAAWTGDEAWLDETVDGLVLLCEQSGWSWAAHDDTFSAHGAVTPTVTDPYLDLGAGEVVAQLAWVDALLGDALDARAPGVRTRVRHEAQERVFEPFSRRRDWHWLGLDGDVHNWNPWIHGNVLVAVLGLVEDPAEAARLVGLVIEGLDRFVASIPADGAIDEGYSYWWNGAGRALEALELLHHATAGTLDATRVPAVRETARFPHRMQVAGPWYVNVADGPARPTPDQPWHVLHRWGRLLGDDAVTAHAASHADPGRPLVTEHAGLGRALRGLTDPSWAAAGRSGATPHAPLPLETWLPSVELLVAREQAGSPAGLTLAVKGGHNDEHHNHDDVGSVIVAIDGVPVVVDAGQPTYTAQTFGPGRYDIWTMQSGWHNVPVVAGTEQPPGCASAAAGVRVELAEHVEHAAVGTADGEGPGPGERAHEAAQQVAAEGQTRPSRSSLSLDLSAAYPGLPPETWRRTVTLDREHGEVVVCDRRSARRSPASLPVPVSRTAAPAAPEPTPADEIRFLLHGEVTLPAPGEAEVRAPRAARAALLRWDPAAATARLTVRTLDDPLLTDVWGDHLTRLDLVLTEANDAEGHRSEGSEGSETGEQDETARGRTTTVVISAGAPLGTTPGPSDEQAA
ncbi:heparinase II/III family protein [Sanguibacter sp. 4.1]|uniref:Heparinase II/III family protein n=1 Tax=Sanguibacter biliveldensis TaxID=3030830 RepID=A0AAF0Z0W0_9MICO|nr:heparinase II/III family protein [Sanguibacter sp. 4.1]WPF80843.1 heparinase II/III family protein [Sanguibacter sp. 4.1]